MFQCFKENDFDFSMFRFSFIRLSDRGSHHRSGSLGRASSAPRLTWLRELSRGFVDSPRNGLEPPRGARQRPWINLDWNIERERERKKKRQKYVKTVKIIFASPERKRARKATCAVWPIWRWNKAFQCQNESFGNDVIGYNDVILKIAQNLWFSNYAWQQKQLRLQQTVRPSVSPMTCSDDVGATVPIPCVQMCWDGTADNANAKKEGHLSAPARHSRQIHVQTASHVGCWLSWMLQMIQMFWCLSLRSLNF